MPRSIRHLLRNTAVVSRPVRVTDSYGNWHAQGWQRVAAIPCRVTEPELVQRTDQQGAIKADLARWLYCEAGADIIAGDRVEIAALGLTANVEGAADQSDRAYRKALIVQE